MAIQRFKVALNNALLPLVSYQGTEGINDGNRTNKVFRASEAEAPE